MGRKSETVFSKLDKQNKKIDNLSEKFEDINIDDLYALARRTWAYGDYITAQKYFNHISLLCPLDWEAPLYASLCNFHGYQNMCFWILVPAKTEPIFIATINYILSRTEMENKESELLRCTQIIQQEINGTVTHYYKYKKDYDDVDINYIFTLETWLLRLFNSFVSLNSPLLANLISFISDATLELITKYRLLATGIDENDYQSLLSKATKHCDISYEQLVSKRKSATNASRYVKSELSTEEINNIKVNGKLYFEFKDKIIAKRRSIKQLIIGILCLVCSLSNILLFITFNDSWYGLFFMIPILLFGVFSFSKYFFEKDKLCCSNLFSSIRKRYRYTSSKDVVLEEKVNISKVFVLIMVFYCVFLTSSVFGFCFGHLSIASIFIILNCLICVICSIVYCNCSSISDYLGYFIVLYNKNYYTF